MTGRKFDDYIYPRSLRSHRKYRAKARFAGMAVEKTLRMMMPDMPMSYWKTPRYHVEKVTVRALETARAVTTGASKKNTPKDRIKHFKRRETTDKYPKYNNTPHTEIAKIACMLGMEKPDSA